MNRLDHKLSHAWHVAINKHALSRKIEWPRWMYEAKKAADEVPRITKLFEMARTGKLPNVHKQCSHSPEEPIENNYLFCCLGVKCHMCAHLLALESAEVPPEGLDVMKAWTCAGHILQSGDAIDTSEGYILTVGDRMFWDGVYENLAKSDEDPI